MVQSAEAWLEKAKPLVLLRPPARLCIEKALKFLPKLRAALRSNVDGGGDEDGGGGDEDGGGGDGRDALDELLGD